VDGVVFSPATWRPDLCAKLYHHVQLPPPLLSVEAPHFRVRENQFQQRASQSSPPRMKVYRESYKAAGNLFGGVACGELASHCFPLRSDPCLVCPVLLAWAKDDFVVPLTRSVPSFQAFANHRLEVFEGGHAAFLEDRSRFEQLLRGFLNQVCAV
jgi:pimeloyl-ACP methyl ester carboxylesterase